MLQSVRQFSLYGTFARLLHDRQHKDKSVVQSLLETFATDESDLVCSLDRRTNG